MNLQPDSALWLDHELGRGGVEELEPERLRFTVRKDILTQGVIMQ